MKILTSDTVLVIAGKDKGKTAKVLQAIPKLNKVLVAEVNFVTKHVKKTQQGPGERIRIERPIDVSNVKIMCPSCNKPARVGYRMLDNGKKQRICKKCNEAIPTLKVTK